MTIWKYPLKIEPEQIIELPWEAELLTVQFQTGVLTLWAKLDERRNKRLMIIRIFRTGHPINSNRLNYIGTAQDPYSCLVWHVFHE